MDLDDLGIGSSLRTIAEKYEKFFNNVRRISKLSKLNIRDYTEETLELGMIASLCSSKTIDTEEIFRNIFIKSIDEDGYICEDEDNKYYIDIKSILGQDVLAKYAQRYYGFNNEDFSIKKLLVTIIITALSKDLDDELLSNYSSYISGEKLNCHLFIDRWMNDMRSTSVYRKVVQVLEKELNLIDVFKDVDIDTIKYIDILPRIDKLVIL